MTAEEQIRLAIYDAFRIYREKEDRATISVVTIGKFAEFFAKEYLPMAAIREQEIAEKAWYEAQSNYDIDKGRSPGLEAYLTSLKQKLCSTAPS